jgi:hypothetical protein
MKLNLKNEKLDTDRNHSQNQRTQAENQKHEDVKRSVVQYSMSQ